MQLKNASVNDIKEKDAYKISFPSKKLTYQIVYFRFTVFLLFTMFSSWKKTILTTFIKLNKKKKEFFKEKCVPFFMHVETKWQWWNF